MEAPVEGTGTYPLPGQGQPVEQEHHRDAVVGVEVDMQDAAAATEIGRRPGQPDHRKQTHQESVEPIAPEHFDHGGG